MHARGPGVGGLEEPWDKESKGSGLVLGLCDSGFTLWEPWSLDLLNESEHTKIAGVVSP